MDTPSSKPKTHRRAVVLAAVVAAAVGGGAVTFAQHAQHVLYGHGGGATDHRQHVQMLLTAAGASDAQKAEFEALVTPALDELEVMHAAHSTALEQLHELLAADTIDHARIEALRTEQVRTIDMASQRFVAALAHAADVLSPEQRAALVRAIAVHSGG